MIAGVRFSVLFLALASLLASAGPASAQCSGVPAADWRNTITNRDDPFFTPVAGAQPRWIKFTILLCDPTTVYFQNSATYPFHFDFASVRLNPFLGMSAAQFDARTLRIAGQEAVLGAVLAPGSGGFGGPDASPNELAIQIVGLDAYPREQVRDWINLVKSRITSAPGVPVLYFPTFEQRAVASANSAWFNAEGIEVSSPQRWTVGGVCYASGWGMGRLVFVPGAQVADAFRNGVLRSDDVLMTDGVPADVPPVQALITTYPATPNSHAAILSATWGIPFVLLQGDEATAAMGLLGRRVIVRAKPSPYGDCDVSVVDAENLAPPVKQYLEQLKIVPPLVFPPYELQNTVSLNTESLVPSDTKRVGGKCANYGVLRRAIPGNVRPAAALTFDVWDRYMNQTLSTGRTLRQEIHFRLDGFTYPPSDQAALSTALAGVRALFTSTTTTSFDPVTSGQILSVLQDPVYSFDPDVKIRFRSSSNVEDLGSFTGAGLYESFSGCLADELDADTIGPSHCDPLEANERGVFRAIRRVFASFYNDYAFLARRRLSVNEDLAGMACLCHHSFPDATELANGVAVLRKFPSYTEVQIVTQLGATSVTNPPAGSIPEEVIVQRWSFGIFAELRTQSNMVVLGEKVMTWETDYTNLANLLVQVGDRYALENSGARPVLEFEFKRTAPTGALEIKQVRQLPAPAGGANVTAALVNRPTRWALFQGETWNGLGLHRLKMDLSTTTDDRVLTPANLVPSFLGNASLTYHADCTQRTLSGRPETWPQATWNITGSEVTLSWRVSNVSNPRTYTLIFPHFVASQPPATPPIVYLTDFGSQDRSRITIRADYDQPVPAIDTLNQPIFTTRDEASLVPVPDPDGIPHTRVISGSGLTITTSFDWVPGGAAAGFTFDLATFNGTTITGLVASGPITLTSTFSQTYAPRHHNFSEAFVFDPYLDPGVSSKQKSELRRRGVAYIYATTDGGTSTVDLRTDACIPCPADIDGSGAVGVGDIFAFLAQYFSADPAADWNASGMVSVGDVFDFLADWFQGC